MDSNFAKCIIEDLNGVPGFYLYIHDRQYGHYPIREGSASIEQISMAIADAKDYGYNGIYFE